MPPLPDLSHIAVWIVEDDDDFRAAFEEIVGPQVALAGVFASVEDALARLDVLRAAHGRGAAHGAGRAAGDGPRPDVVLLDVNLPGLDGIEGIAAIKQRVPDARIVMQTIRDDADTIAASLGAGASGYLTKDATPDEILQGVRAAHAGGMWMQPDVARKVLAAFERRPPPPDYGLTAREREVLAEMVAGGTQREIADRLFVSASTVNTHIQHLYEKLHVHSGSAAVAKAIREGLVDE